MFNKSYDLRTYNHVVNIKPACNGTIQKSAPLSRIVKCDVNSNFAKCLLDEINPHIIKNEWVSSRGFPGEGDYRPGYEDRVNIPIIVLQVMVFGDNQCLIEFITEEDFDKSKQEVNE